MEPYLGAYDNQTPEQKDRNFTQEELVATVAPVVWTEKPRENWINYKGRNQDGSGTCVCMTYSTELSILFFQKYGVWVDFTSAFPYQKRTNPEVSGCNSTDIYSVFPKIGNVFESFMPSQNMSDMQAMAIKCEKYYNDLALPFRAYRVSLPIDFDTVASTAQVTGKGVMVWFRFSMQEWTNIPQVLNFPMISGHSVTVVDVILKDGKEYLVIQDSWGLQYADKGLRLISREYFNARCFLASYLKSFKPQDNAVLTRPIFDGSIISAQKCFKWEGLLSSDVLEVENWGSMTRKACVDFQKKYGITPTLGNFGSITKAKLTDLYK